MFEWLFGRKKTETKVTQEVKVSGSRNKVVQTTTVVNQRGAKAKGDIVGGNKYSTYRQEVRTTVYDPLMDPLNPLSPVSPLNPIYQTQTESHSHSHSHSHDSSSSWHSHDSSSSSSYDSGSSSYDSGSSYSSSSD